MSGLAGSRPARYSVALRSFFAEKIRRKGGPKSFRTPIWNGVMRYERLRKILPCQGFLNKSLARRAKPLLLVKYNYQASEDDRVTALFQMAGSKQTRQWQQQERPLIKTCTLFLITGRQLQKVSSR
jgi:hypothetical protein